MKRLLIALVVIIALSIFPASAIVDNLTGTQSVLNFNGTTGSTTMLDGNRTIVWNTAGSAQLNQSNFKWGGSSLRLFGAANKGNVSVQGNDFAAVGAGDYTVEFWFNMTDHEPVLDMFVSQDSGTGFAFYYENAGQYYQLYQNGNLTTIGKTPATTGVWHHLALVRQGGYEHIYLDGTSITATTVSAISPITPSNFHIGSWGNGASYFFNGFIDDFRFSKYAVYTADFTPPTKEFVYEGTPGIYPDFSANITEASQYGMTVQFTNTTTYPQITTWNWTFGDGNTSGNYEEIFDSSSDALSYVGDVMLVNTTGGYAYQVDSARTSWISNYTATNFTIKYRTYIDANNMRLGFWGKEYSTGALNTNGNHYFLGVNRAACDFVKVVAGTPTGLSGTTTGSMPGVSGVYDVEVRVYGNVMQAIFNNGAYTHTVVDTSIAPGGYFGFNAMEALPTQRHVFNFSISNTSSAITYDTSTAMQPTYTYDVAGRYSVILNATNATGYNRVYKQWYINLTRDSDVYLKSWQHMNGVTGGATFTDLQGNAWSVNSVTTDTSVYKYGNASALFNSGGDYLRSSSAVIDLGAQPFTIEGWVRPTSSGSNQFIISRTTSSTSRNDGWGLYHSTASATSDGWVFWMGNAAANSTGTFTLPLNTWNHYAVERFPNNTVIVFVNGVPVASKTGMSGSYDVAVPTSYGNPPIGTGSSFIGNLDETRISVGVDRWGTTFTPPYAEYRGLLFDTTPDINVDSTLRYKTDPPNSAPIANLTPRNRTAQIQNIPASVTNISLTMTYNPNHYRVVRVIQNSTMWAGINYTYVYNDIAAGTVMINATRPGGFSTTGLTDNRGSVADIEMNYWNYTDCNCEDDAVLNYQYFSNGFLRNGTTGIEYPVHNFIATNVTPLTWITYSNFTASNTTGVVGITPFTFNPLLNMSASRYLWDFGDGTTFLSANTTITHTYSTPGLKNVSLTAYLWQNTSVTNTTTLNYAVNVTYPNDYISVNFAGNPTSGTPSLLVSFTDLSTRYNVSSQTCEWTFGDPLSTMPNSSTCGDTQHVYSYGGIYSVNYSVTTPYGTSYEYKADYIVVSAGQSSNIIWSPSSVAIQVLDANRNPIVGAPVHLNAYSSSLPGGLSGAVDYFKNTYGVTTSTAQSMFNASTTYDGTTDDYGFVATQVVEIIQYQITTRDVNGISETRLMWPTGPYFQIVTANATVSGIAAQGRAQSSIYKNSTFNTTFWEPNTTHSCMGINVYDSTGQTTNVSAWWTLIDNSTTWWTNSTFIGGYGPINSTRCVLHVPYQRWKWGGITG